MSNDFNFGDTPPPVEPNADIRQAALGMRQIFVAYTEAGFTDAQALQLTLGMIAAGMKGSKE